MPINISNITHNISQTNRSHEHKQVKAVHGDANQYADDKNSVKQSRAQNDSVSLTGSFQQVTALKEQIARLPIIDMQKVEDIKNTINDGSFKLNTDNIATKFIRYEKELA